MVFKNRVKNIQAAAYIGAHTVHKVKEHLFFQIQIEGLRPNLNSKHISEATLISAIFNFVN